MLRRSFARVASPFIVSAMLIAVAGVVAGPQETKPPSLATKVEKADQPAKVEPPQSPGIEEPNHEFKAEVDRLIAAYDLKPHPLPSIPDDPPPHEGAMISLPYVVDAPDLVIVEVLEALTGRPISGERLVRPDGKISLGFYGEVDVRGLTLPQVKVAIIKQIRQSISDETLGLITGPDFEEGGAGPFDAPPIPRKPAIPDPPQEGVNPFVPLEKSGSSPDRPRAARNQAPSRRRTGGRVPVRPVRARGTRVEMQDQAAPTKSGDQPKVVGVGKGKVTIIIDIDGAGQPAVAPAVAVAEEPPPVVPQSGPRRIVPPAESESVFVDITAYNSKNYYILGDVQVPGKLPWTGNETVLDAIQYAGGLIVSAESKDIRLVRPGRGGKPAKVYKVDLAAIQDRGDITANYQLFPGDRLVVGRNEVVKKTVDIDRLNAPIIAISDSIQRTANSMRAVQAVSPNGSAQLWRDLVDFWAKELSRKGDLKIDEDALREALLQKRKPAPAPQP